MLALEDEQALDALDDAPKAVIFKHSTQCPVSAGAHREVEAFVRDHPDVPVYRVLVIEQRPLSDAIALRVGVRHQSPQVLVLRDGRLASHVSHFGVTRDALVAATAG